MELQKWLQSSTDDKTVSNTVRGIVTAVAGFIVFIAPFFNFDVTAGTVLIDVNGLAGAFGIGVGTVWATYGLILKFIMMFGRA